MADKHLKTHVSNAPGADAGGRAHTRLDKTHPAGTGPRTDRQVGGPVAEKGAATTRGTEPGAHGAPRAEWMEPH